MRASVLLLLVPAVCGCSGLIGDADKATERPGPGEVCRSIESDGAPVPMRRLTASQVERTVRDVLGVDATLAVTDERLFTYRSNVSSPVDAVAARGYLDFAEETVEQANLDRCADTSCLAWLLDEVGYQLFRRPLDAAQRSIFTTVYEEGVTAGGHQEGARWTLEAMLQSPSFLYLDEVVDEDGYLDDYSIAARMALVLWGSNPDLELLGHAAQGHLSTAEDVRAQAVQMLADPRGEGGFFEFVDQWLGLARLDNAETRPDLAALGADTVNALREEPVALFGALVVEGGGVAQLMTTSRTTTFVALETLYGSDIVGTHEEHSNLDPNRRAGILSLPGVMAALSHAEGSSPTMRGHAVLSSILCTPPAPPPAGVNVTLPEVGPDVTTRERLEAHFSDESCASCHRNMDGIGFAFESFDWLGRSRTEEHGKPIDDQSTVTLDGATVTIDGPIELVTAMAGSPAVADCVGRQWARYASGIPESDEAECLLAQLEADLGDDTNGLQTMMLTYLGSDWFRRGPGEAR